ncbi:HNH endonuclease [Frankia sp. EI5c]|uniref:HNH endonuclease signature motif containing protein n=1 Tax=Frankia sp. EI5c TaxID=683316 RepID=UPI0007C207AA|nr:HNH endonuclease signature motif containing protein [Frankia sp. EI5c]OAA21751.1 HNH endonuclease [Frankia sp. EI5c]
MPDITGFPADPDAVPLDDLETAICQWAGRLAAATCSWLLLLAAFDRRGGWSGIGVRSCAHWLSWRCGLRPRTARDHLATAHALTRLPAVRAAFAAGTISYSKVRAVIRVARPDTEELWLNHALHCTAGQLESLARAYRQRTASPDDHARARARRRVTWSTDDDGMLRLTAVLTPDEGSQLIAALDAAQASLGSTPEEPEPEPDPATDPQRAADALVALAEGFLQHGAPTLTTPTHGLTVHVNAATLGSAEPGGWAETSTPVSLPAAVLQRLGCDGAIRALVTDARGNPLYLGRRRRLPTRRLRAAVHARDHGTCQYPGCANTRWLHIHHLIPWAQGGRTDLDSLTLICGTHHRQVHDQGIVLRRAADGAVTAHLPDGRTLTTAPALDPGDQPVAAFTAATEHIAPHDITTRNGGPFRLGDSLHVLLQEPAA